MTQKPETPPVDLNARRMESRRAGIEKQIAVLDTELRNLDLLITSKEQAFGATIANHASVTGDPKAHNQRLVEMSAELDSLKEKRTAKTAERDELNRQLGSSDQADASEAS